MVQRECLRSERNEHVGVTPKEQHAAGEVVLIVWRTLIGVRHLMEARTALFSLLPPHPQWTSHLWFSFNLRSLFIQACSFLLIYTAYR